MATTSTVIDFPILRDDNPYYSGVVFQFDDGSLALDRVPLDYEQSDADRYYTVGDMEEIDMIAYEGYNNSKLWWVIADANNILFPFQLDRGTTLLIPDEDQVQIQSL